MWSKNFSRGLRPLNPNVLFSFTSYDTSTLAMAGGYRTVPLVNSIVTLHALHPFGSPSSWPNPFCSLFHLVTPFFVPLPKDATLAKPLVRDSASQKGPKLLMSGTGPSEVSRGMFVVSFEQLFPQWVVPPSWGRYKDFRGQ